MMTSYKSGQLAELIALLCLIFKGYRLVAKNYKTGKGTHAGEIDLIVKKKDVIVFVEVKKRATIANAAYSISSNQQERIKRGAIAFISKHSKYKNCDLRFDAILVQLPCKVEHLKNAWF